MPEKERARTRVYLMATAGLRRLDKKIQEAVLESCRITLRASGFMFHDSWASVITGKLRSIQYTTSHHLHAPILTIFHILEIHEAWEGLYCFCARSCARIMFLKWNWPHILIKSFMNILGSVHWFVVNVSRFRGGCVRLGLGQLRTRLSPWRSASNYRNRRAWWCICSGTRILSEVSKPGSVFYDLLCSNQSMV